jgi:hypothetical protein
VNAHDMPAAKIKNEELSKQGQVVAHCMAVIDGKLEAMTALQEADTLPAARAGIDQMILNEVAELFAILTRIFPDFLGGVFKKDLAPLKKHEDAFEKAYMTFLHLKGKGEIRELV